jgi:hypothetical protein
MSGYQHHDSPSRLRSEDRAERYCSFPAHMLDFLNMEGINENEINGEEINKE